MGHSQDILARHRAVWQEKKILREVYREWYGWIRRDLAGGDGVTLELGAGSGNFKAYYPPVLSSDIDFQPWLDLCFDALAMPFKTGSVANIVLIDVLHHLADPVGFFREAARILRPGGRILLLEPYPSPFSLFVYKRVHPEPFIFDLDYTAPTSSQKATGPAKDPWEANQAMAFLLFYRGQKDFLPWLQQEHGVCFKKIIQNRAGCILYPASGGFEHHALLPNWALPFFKILEKLLTPFLKWLAFRCYVVLEKC